MQHIEHGSPLIEIIRRFRQLRVLVLGDVMLDTYLEGEATRLCSEAPVPVVRKVLEQHIPGGAANVAANIHALEAEVLLVGVVGCDPTATSLRTSLQARGIADTWLVEDEQAPTLHKVRLMANGQYVVRFDEGGSVAYSSLTQQHLLANIAQLYPLSDVVILSDYRYGVLSTEVITTLQQLHTEQPKPILVDSKGLEHFRDFPAAIVTPNYGEAKRFVDAFAPQYTTANETLNDVQSVQHLADQMLACLSAEYVAITLAEHGVVLKNRQGFSAHIPAYAVAQAHDVGAGDSFSATVALALAAQSTMLDAAHLGIDASGVTVTKQRTSVVTYQELLQCVGLHPAEHTVGAVKETQTIDAHWREAKKILLVRLDNLGDVLVTTPAFHALKQALPQASLTLLASPAGAQVASLNPDIDDVLVYDAPWTDPWQTLPQDSEREQAMIATLKARNFDAAIIFTSFRQSALPAAYMCYLADIPLRAAASIDGPGSLLTTRHKHPEHMMHEVERGLDLLGALGITADEQHMVLHVPDDVRDKVHERIDDFKGQRPLIVVHPGCSMPARTYPWEMYADVIHLLIAQLDAFVVLTGSQSEQDVVARILTHLPEEQHPFVFNAAGELSFAELCGVIADADLTITNNTGPMHIASALQTPVIALFALTNPPEQWGPWQVPYRQLYHDVPCRICYQRVCPYQHDCLRLVSPQRVVDEAQALLAEVQSDRDCLETEVRHE